MAMQPNVKYEEMLDWLEEKNKLLSFKLKQAEGEVKDWRNTANSLAHALALSTDGKQPLWVLEYYRKWENKQREWLGV